MTTLDRMFFAGYLRSYLIVLVSLLSLYIIVDLFTNLDDFSKGATVAEGGELLHLQDGIAGDLYLDLGGGGIEHSDVVVADPVVGGSRARPQASRGGNCKQAQLTQRSSAHHARCPG